MINDDRITLLLIGRGSEKEKLKQRAKKRENIKFLDYVSNNQLHLYYNLADVLIMPSITTKAFKEPWGFVINESMCQKCAIITSDAVGATQSALFEEGVNGYMVSEKSVF